MSQKLGVGGETAYAISRSFNLFGKNEEEGLRKPQIHYLNILRLQEYSLVPPTLAHPLSVA